MGFLGILETNKLPHVPATIFLDEGTHPSTRVASGLKHGTGRNAHIVLVPQPSDDPNDPLNWSMTRKVVAMLIIWLGGCLFASTISSLLNSGLYVIAIDFNAPIGKMALLSGYQLLVAGSTGALVSAASRKWGKRPVFLASSLLGLLGSIIGSTTNTYNGLLAARIVQGGSTAAYESLMISIIGDLFFVHQRGYFMAITQLVLGGISMFANVITGPITSRLGWKWLFHFCILVAGIQTILLFFFIPETQFKRDQRYNTDENIEDDLAEKTQTHPKVSQLELVGAENEERQEQPRAKKTFWQNLAIFTGTYSNENLLQLMVAPFAACLNVAVLWVVVISGTITATYVAQAIVLAQVFSPPPYNMTPEGVGNLFLGPFIGGLIATALMGFINDPLITWCARKNGGIYEPDYRLLITLLGATGGAGLMAFGALCQSHASFYATATAHGLALFGIQIINNSICSYGLDAFREMSSDIFVAAIIYKNFLFYGFSWFVNDWLARKGPATVFYVLGGVLFALLATTPVMFFFGKRYRAWWARHNLLDKLHIKAHAEM